MHEHGHTFLIALLNALDDTKAIKKSIFDPLYGDLKTLVSNNYGRRVVQWMVAPGDTSCFHPGFIETIELGLKFGKKDKATRRQEILDQVEAPISLAMAESPAFWLSNNHIGLVTANILKHRKHLIFFPEYFQQQFSLSLFLLSYWRALWESRHSFGSGNRWCQLAYCRSIRRGRVDEEKAAGCGDLHFQYNRRAQE